MRSLFVVNNRHFVILFLKTTLLTTINYYCNKNIKFGVLIICNSFVSVIYFRALVGLFLTNSN